MKTRLGDSAAGALCLKFGRDVTRMQCGIAYAVEVLKGRAPRKTEMIAVGLSTTVRAAKELEAVTPEAKTLAGKVSRMASKLAEVLKTDFSVKALGEARQKLTTLRDLTMQIYAQGETRCTS